MNQQDDFEERNRATAVAMAADPELRALTREWFRIASRYEYSYHFSWLGRPIIQFPQDLLALQEIVWSVRPDLIVETGIARGGSLVFYASLLELIGGDGRVVGVDIEVRPQNRLALDQHALRRRIDLIDGSSVEPSVVAEVHRRAAGCGAVMVVLDSLHTHDHVLGELHAYSPLVTVGSYLVALDTVIEDMPPDFSEDRPWGPGNSPKTAVRQFLAHTDRFEVDRQLEAKLLISVAPEGYLRRVR
jgi:cephalosporin hydroxylase